MDNTIQSNSNAPQSSTFTTKENFNSNPKVHIIWGTILLFAILLTFVITRSILVNGKISRFLKQPLPLIDPGRQTIDLPIKVNGETVLGIGYMYKFQTKLNSVNTNGELTNLEVNDNLGIPPITVSSNTKIFSQNSRDSSNLTTANSLSPGQRISLVYIYRSNSPTPWELQQIIINEDIQ